MSQITKYWPSAPGRCLVIAHRGASRAAPENTLAAFRLALDEGADGVECDVWPSADGVPVVIHDPQVNRTTNGTGRLRDLTRADLRTLDAGAWFDPRFKNERIPTLYEVAGQIAGRAALNIELKGRYLNPEPFVAAVIEALEDAGVMAQAHFSSFHRRLLVTVRRLAPQARVGYLFARRQLLNPLRRARNCGAAALHPHFHLVTPALVDEAHARGLQVYPWTVDEPAIMRQLIAARVDGIITNYPARLRAVLDESPEEKSA